MVNRVGHASCYKGNYNKKLNTEILKRAALVKGLSINRRFSGCTYDKRYFAVRWPWCLLHTNQVYDIRLRL